jgi:uncharacterized protein (DUF2336 family)
MSVPASLLPELEEVVQHGSAERRAETLRRITSLFLEGAAGFHDEHVALFDDVIGCLIEEIELKALAELARRLAPVPNAPHGVVTTLAKNDNIAVAGPVLKQAHIDDPDLKHIAETKSQAHLLALSSRLAISETLSDVLVRRGDGAVARSVATNPKARLSEDAFNTLVKPDTKAEIRRVLTKVTSEVAAKAAPRDYTAALAAVQALHKERKLTEADVAEYAKSGKYEETIAALATVSAVPVEVVDRLMNGERSDPVLILARAAGFGWRTVRAVMNSRSNLKPSGQTLEAARENFERLTAATAQRVVRFWQVRQGTGE